VGTGQTDCKLGLEAPCGPPTTKVCTDAIYHMGRFRLQFGVQGSGFRFRAPSKGSGQILMSYTCHVTGQVSETILVITSDVTPPASLFKNHWYCAPDCTAWYFISEPHTLFWYQAVALYCLYHLREHDICSICCTLPLGREQHTLLFMLTEL
jgi:hypothetical protein